jgi:carbonic anhydrase
LIVLGVFVEVGQHNEEFEKLIKSLTHIKLKGQEADLKETLSVKNLFPSTNFNLF